MNSISTVAKYLTENANSLAIEIVDEILDKFEFTVPEEEIKQAIVVYKEFIGFLGQALISTEMKVPDGLIEWSKRNGEREAALMGRISSIIGRYPDTRLVFSERINKIILSFGLSAEDVIFVNKRLNLMLDISITETIIAFERLTDNILKTRQGQINELSAPIVPIQEGVAVLPLIGSVDFERAEHLLNKVVPKIPQLRVECLIIDFSGIVTIDAEVAGHIFNIYDVLRLLGINVIMTGIRPELATKVVHRGIDFSSFTTYSNVMQAIESIK
ncbi:anti-anti-sigma factor [Bacillus sp. V3-13]|uniref:STAS domain-containing protein n=1 Tax=Bacillus sp. V3-13 TaxID=2053728 RepID=UPI000C778143|nr:STAS domain-containing protein [Bacillus sp. V3-13]PLR77361.1 anti-anti-sigma factor [Bacillus sp. V3-13]